MYSNVTKVPFIFGTILLYVLFYDNFTNLKVIGSTALV
jgi:hypothetical protein